METWFNEVKAGSHRDQLSFNYAAWRNKDVKFVYIDKQIYDSEWFKWNQRHRGRKKTKTTPAISKPKISTTSSGVRKNKDFRDEKQWCCKRKKYGY